MGNGPDVYVKEQTGKFFVVEHRYMPTPHIDQPSSFDERSIVIQHVGTAATLAEAEQIKSEYLAKLRTAAQKEEEDDED